ncbi:Integral membrane protein TerC [Kribbella flavida DSM 17836]|uniref:Integral membrane protein TerC n=1 Tax=Kribbella flavida (strain DSM 17836 / JCM 10339 / NBRC 14399) TaxID=479435 RepID=D2PSA4_KRIFD|nr:TerC family protein [Kribbella flavida]ADB31228.1 Integral membrane protein TerC [Kribbella flavida DSM 17836]
MTVSLSAWIITIAVLLALLVLDFLIVARKPHEPSLREATLWVSFYVGIALLFGVGLTIAAGGRSGGEFFAGWLTEYSLSVDNLFVFIIIMGKFAVPRQYQQKVLLVGVALALVMRGIFIAIGAEAISHFNWVFYLFGAFLLYTAWKLATTKEEEEFKENVVLTKVRRVLPTTETYHEAKLTTRVDGKRFATPMLIVMIAIGTTDLLFALDSIPAIFGLTQEPYLVFTANAFALMGLRQLFFLIGGLLDRLVYLSYGLSVVLGFIGVKLILEALHHSGVSWAPEIPILVSLSIILGTLTLTAVLSLVKSSRDAKLDKQKQSAGVE